MKRGTTTFLKAAVWVIGITVLALCAFLLPELAKNTALANPEYAYLKFPILFGLYITAIPFYLALYQSIKLLNYIENEKAFSNLVVISLRHIKNYAITILVLYAIGMVLLAMQNALHPGIAIIGFVIIFATFVILFFASLLQELLRNALEIKEENELTV